MYERWGDFFFMIGSSSAALIGLMFVVITLTAGRDREEIERGKKLYTSPIVWDLAVILVLSGAAIAPTMTIPFFAAACGGLGILGVLRGVRSSVGISRLSNVAARIRRFLVRGRANPGLCRTDRWRIGRLAERVVGADRRRGRPDGAPFGQHSCRMGSGDIPCADRRPDR